jgi:hypothetical protein
VGLAIGIGYDKNLLDQIIIQISMKYGILTGRLHISATPQRLAVFRLPHAATQMSYRLVKG